MRALLNSLFGCQRRTAKSEGVTPLLSGYSAGDGTMTEGSRDDNPDSAERSGLVKPKRGSSLVVTPEATKQRRALGHMRTGLKHVKAADVTLLFPLQIGNEDTKVNGNKLMHRCFETIGEEQALQIFGTVGSALKDKWPTLREVRAAFLTDFTNWLDQCGMNTRKIKSVDHDELFLCISLDDFDVQEFVAEQMKMRMQTTPGLVQALGIVQPVDVSAAYLTFNAKFAKQKAEELGETSIYQKFYDTYDDGSIFRGVDRIRMIYRSLEQLCDLNSLVASGVLIAHFPIHVRHVARQFQQEWGNLSLRRLFDPRTKQPFGLIRDYFGENIAFYFVWIGFSISSCVPLAGMGLGFGILDWLYPQTRYLWIAGWVSVVVVWSTLYMILWNHCQDSYQVEWDMLNLERGYEHTRADFRGKRIPSKANMNRMHRNMPAWQKCLRWCVSALVTIIFVLWVLYLVSYIFSLRSSLVERFGPRGATIISGLISVQIQVCGLVWSFVAPALVWFENPRTDREYVNASIWKQFLFQAINYYNSFFYTAFVMKYSEAGCPNDDCLGTLQHSLIVTYLILAGCSIAQMVIMKLGMRWALYQEDKKLEAMHQENEGLGSSEKFKRSSTEMQGKRITYTLDQLIADYLNSVLSMGYVFLFSVAAPHLVFIAVVVLLLQLRVGAWSLCAVLRRPFPYPVDGIGDWNKVLNLLTSGSLTCTIAIVVEHSQVLDHFSWRDKLLLFFIVERVAQGIRFLLFQIIPQRSNQTMLILKRRQEVLDALQGRRRPEE